VELEERPPPPGSVFAQRVAYTFIALSLLVTIAFPVFMVVTLLRAYSQMR